MHGSIVVPVLLGVLMAPQAAPAYFLRRHVFKGENFGLVPASVDVLFPWTVAGFTTLPLRAFLGFQLSFHGGDKVRGGLKMVVDFFVTRLACVSADVEVWIAGEKRLLWRGLSLISGPLVS